MQMPLYLTVRRDLLDHARAAEGAEGVAIVHALHIPEDHGEDLGIGPVAPDPLCGALGMVELQLDDIGRTGRFVTVLRQRCDKPVIAGVNGSASAYRSQWQRTYVSSHTARG